MYHGGYRPLQSCEESYYIKMIIESLVIINVSFLCFTTVFYSKSLSPSTIKLLKSLLLNSYYLLALHVKINIIACMITFFHHKASSSTGWYCREISYLKHHLLLYVEPKCTPSNVCDFLPRMFGTYICHSFITEVSKTRRHVHSMEHKQQSQPPRVADSSS